MNFERLETKLYSFWRLQIVGWMAYIGFYYIHMLLVRETNPQDVGRITIIFFCGFIVTTFLRFYYRRIDYRSKTLGSLAVIVILSSFFSANVWFWASRYIAWSIVYGSQQFMVWLHKGKPPSFIAPIFFDTLLFISWSALYFTIKIWIEWNRERTDTETAEHLAQSTQLHMIRYQLNPHFLFNALNAIRALIAEDKNNAKSMITDLSEFLRYSLISKNHPIVPLKMEIAAIRQYLAIEKRRYEDKLDIAFDISPEAEDYPIISFLIHPLAENAVRCGMKTSTMPLVIRIQAAVENDRLTVDVSNTGNWDDSEPVREDSWNGLTHVRERLKSAYPDAHTWMQTSQDGCVHTRFTLNKSIQVKDEEKTRYVGCG